MKQQLSLQFDEQALYAIYQPRIDALVDGHKKHQRKDIVLVRILMVGSIVSLLLCKFHPDWAYFAAGLFIGAIGLSLKLYRQHRLIQDHVQHHKWDMQAFVQRCQHTPSPNYLFDDEEIDYFEANKWVVNYKWDNLQGYLLEPNYIHLNFGSKEDTLLIPYAMTDPSRFQALSEVVRKKIRKSN